MVGNVYVSYGYQGYASWLQTIGLKVVNSISKADLLLLAGGEDISPSLYKTANYAAYGINRERDSRELIDIKFAIQNEIPILGICRGAQYLCAEAGGVLIQDMSHNGVHTVKWFDEETTITNSLHHQMAYPQFGLTEGEDYFMLAYARNLSPHKKTTMELYTPDSFKEAEVVYYPKIKGLGIQGHPEMMERWCNYNQIKGEYQPLRENENSIDIRDYSGTMNRMISLVKMLMNEGMDTYLKCFYENTIDIIPKTTSTEMGEALI